MHSVSNTASTLEAQKEYQIMIKSPAPKLIMRLAIPTIISMLVTNIYNTADTYFVSRMGNSASGAVGIVFSLMALYQAIGYMCGHGSGSYISRYLGGQRIKKMPKPMVQQLFGCH